MQSQSHDGHPWLHRGPFHALHPWLLWYTPSSHVQIAEWALRQGDVREIFSSRLSRCVMGSETIDSGSEWISFPG